MRRALKLGIFLLLALALPLRGALSPHVAPAAVDPVIWVRGGDGGGGLAGLLRSLLEALKALLASTDGGKSSSTSTSSSTGAFQDFFEEVYGSSHPKFAKGSFIEATDLCRRTSKLCLVYIAGPRAGKRKKNASEKADDTLCHTLTEPEVAEFINDNFIFWAADGGGSAGAAAKRKVGARSLPFLGVVHTSASAGKRTTVSLHHCNPAPAPAAMMSWMKRLLQLQEPHLKMDAEHIRRVQENTSIARERQEGYRKAIMGDVKRQEEEARAAEEEAQATKEAAEAAEKQEMEEKRRAALLAEIEAVSEPAAGDGVAAFQLTLPGGAKHRRRFDMSASTLRNLYEWADALGVDLEVQVLVTRAPVKIVLSPTANADTALRDSELSSCGSQIALFVESSASS